MSTRPTTPGAGRVTLPELAARKVEGRPIVMVTAHDHPSAVIAEEAGVDVVLVGDSAAMTVLGYDSTVPAAMDELLMLAAAARRGLHRPLLVADLPFGSYQPSDRDALLAGTRFLKEAGADAVKLEGAGPALDRIRALAGAGIPVMAHLGLTPQTATALGGYRAQARTADAAVALVGDARAAEAAGAFALVLECVPAVVARHVTERLVIPTIGIGAGLGCDGQVLVHHDLLGLGGEGVPRFVRRYAALRPTAVKAVRRYAEDVRARRFPAEEHTYAMAADDRAAFEAALDAVPRPASA